MLKKESSPRLKVTIRPSGDKLGATAESVKFVICVYSDGEVTGADGLANRTAPPRLREARAPRRSPPHGTWDVAILGEAFAIATLPELLSRSRRFRSAFISEAC